MCICVLILIPLFRDYEMPKDLQDFIKYLEYVATCYSIKLCCYQNYSHFIIFFPNPCYFHFFNTCIYNFISKCYDSLLFVIYLILTLFPLVKPL